MASKKKLTASEVEKYKKVLLERKQVIEGTVQDIERDNLHNSSQDAAGNLSKVPIDMADLGTDNYERELTLEILENQEEEIYEIDEALARIEAGTYGRCERCDNAIPKTRLRIKPYARLCIECRRREESFGADEE